MANGQPKLWHHIVCHCHLSNFRAWNNTDFTILILLVSIISVAMCKTI